MCQTCSRVTCVNVSEAQRVTLFLMLNVSFRPNFGFKLESRTKVNLSFGLKPDLRFGLNFGLKLQCKT